MTDASDRVRQTMHEIIDRGSRQDWQLAPDAIRRDARPGWLRIIPRTSYLALVAAVVAIIVAGSLVGVAASERPHTSTNHKPQQSKGQRPHSPVTPPPPSPATTASPATTTPKQTSPPLNLETLPVPSDYTCSAGLYLLGPANEAASVCVPYAYLVGGTASDPNNNTACPAGSLMTMGPVECDAETGIVTPVPPGPNTCSTPGGPCASSNLPFSSQASTISWSAIGLPTGMCSAGYYFGETNGIATCVPYEYVPGGTSANPNNNTACPAGSGLNVLKLTGTLCTQDAAPYDIVAPVPA
jgi:hypothetical protein